MQPTTEVLQPSLELATETADTYELNDLQLKETEINDQEITSEQNTVSNTKLTFFKVVALMAVLLNPLFAGFLYVAIEAVIEETRANLDLENTAWQVLFIAINITISVMSGLSDLLVVNTIEEAKLMCTYEPDDEAAQLVYKNQFEQYSVKTFTFFNQLIGKTSFLAGSATAAVSIAYISSNVALRWTMFTPIVIMELIYLDILYKAAIDEHSYEFIHRLYDLSQSMLIKALKSPAKSLEVNIQVLVNAVNRAIFYGYIMQQFLIEFFDLDTDRTAISLIGYATATSFYTSLTSRTLNVYKQFFNPQFAELSLEEIKNTKVSYVGTGIDCLMSSIRAISASILVYRNGTDDTSSGISLAAVVGIFLMSHNLYVRYQNRLYQTALDAKVAKTVKANFRSIQSTLSELSAEELFDYIKDQFKIKRKIKLTATIINTGSRLANWFSFLGFLITMNDLLTKNNYTTFDFYDLLCIQQLVCNPSLENEVSFYQERIVDILAYYHTKVFMERKSPRVPQHNHYIITRCLKSFWRTRSDYPKEYLQQFIPNEPDRLESIVLTNISLSPTTEV